MILRDELGGPVAKQVGGAVADIEQSELTATYRHDDDGAAHAFPFGVFLRRLEDRGVRLLAGPAQTSEVRPFVAVLGQHPCDRFRRD